MEYMDLDEFLSENGIPLGEGQGRSPPSKSLTPPRLVASADGSSGSGLVRCSLPSSGSESPDSNKAGSSVGTPLNYPRLVFLSCRIKGGIVFSIGFFSIATVRSRLS
jgi:hypothetical protein